jgi:hypothetical protein
VTASVERPCCGEAGHARANNANILLLDHGLSPSFEFGGTDHACGYCRHMHDRSACAGQIVVRLF